MKFRVPTLRNIEVTFPYMHDGRYKKLREVIKYYTEELNTKTTYLSPRLKRKISLNSNEQKRFDCIFIDPYGQRVLIQ